MSNEEIRLAIAEACGWKWYRHPSASSLQHPHYRFLALPIAHEYEQSPQWMVRADMTEKLCAVGYMVKEFNLPDYCDDLNAMHEAEKTLDAEQLNYSYSHALYNIVVPLNQQPFRATARQRAEAFLKTKGLWK